MTPEQFQAFCCRCQEVIICDSVATFTGYDAGRDEYHGDRAIWWYPISVIITLMQDHLEDWNDCETDEERTELVQILVEDAIPYGDSSKCNSDYSTVYYNTEFYNWKDPEEEAYLKKQTDVCFIEVYPYRYGTYSGMYDMQSKDFIEFYSDGDHSPCGGPDELYALVPPNVIQTLKQELK